MILPPQSSNLQTIKNLIRESVKNKQICENYQDILCANTETGIIKAGRDVAEWAFSNNVLNSALLSLFTPATLITNGVYFTGSHSIINPNLYEIFVTGTANVTVDLTTCARLRIVVLSNEAQLTVNAMGNSFFKILKYKNISPVNISMSGNASCVCDFSGAGNVSVLAESDTIFHCIIRENVFLNYSGSESAFAQIKMYEHSSLSYQAAESAMQIKSYNQSTIIPNGSSQQ